ncbi:hypothetical protein PHPALM_19032 [Phytophthora palmivora]|uniref:Uncharacterized protein n=1 Tax=Phytophthora palmivora TaxID=4796 RepID=A0A2P4XIA0_9STRA|nr:hypothetical protein PHPALM_19032 [Phytophthora palmivora]
MHYTIKEKRRVLLATQGLSQCEAASSQNIPRWTINTWRKGKDDIFSFRGSEKMLSRAPGRPETIPFRVELIVFMKDTRRESRPLTASLMAAYIREEHSGWLDSYAEGKKDRFYIGCNDVLLICMLLQANKEKLEDLVEVQDKFAKFFQANYSSYAASQVFNCDETGIYFDAPPGKILSE